MGKCIQDCTNGIKNCKAEGDCADSALFTVL